VLVLVLLFYLRKSTILNWLLTLSLSIFSFTAVATPPFSKYPKVENNVAYSKVAALPFVAADEQISYGAESLQYALFWRAKQVKGVIGLAAITDIEEYAAGSNSCQKVTKNFMQGMPKDKPAEYHKANPSKQPLHIKVIKIILCLHLS